MPAKPQHHEQITIFSEGRERTLNVQVTVEEEENADALVCYDA